MTYRARLTGKEKQSLLLVPATLPCILSSMAATRSGPAGYMVHGLGLACWISEHNCMP